MPKNGETPTIQELRKIPLFKNCESDFWKNIERESLSQKYEKGKIIFIHGEPAERIYAIKSGWVKLFRETAGGSQAVIDIHTQGNVFGETAIFENNAYPYSAEIVEDAEIISVPLSALKKEMETNNKLALDMLAIMARYRRQQDREIEHLSMQNAPQRIGCFLLRLARQDEKGKLTISLPYDKTLIAAKLGMQPETFSRALSKLHEQTGIETKGSVIHLKSLDQLVSYSCSNCSSEFPCKDLLPSG